MAVLESAPLGHFEHGGDLYGRADAIDFSASLNPLGMPETALEALRANVSAFEAYPDVHNRGLTEAVALFEGVDAQRVCMCAGATDAFDRIVDALSPHGVLLFDPCFSGYERALRRCGAPISHVPLYAKDDFDFTERALGAACMALAQENGPDLVFLCTPNNPTGRAVGIDFLRGLLAYAQHRKATVVLDACFADLARLESAIPLQEEFPNLIVVKAFTKTFAMAGLRLGYVVSADGELAQRFHEAGAQWSVSVPAQIAGIAALREEGYLERTLACVDAERARLEAALADAGMRVVPSCVNYILFQCALSASDAAALFERMAERGIIMRRCGNFAELDDTWYRIAVRTAEENTRFIEALKEVLGR